MINFINKSGKGKIYVFCYISLLALLVMFCIIKINLYKSYNYNGHRLYLYKVYDYTLIMRDKDNNLLTMTVDPEKSYIYDFKCNINYLDESISYIDSFKDSETTMVFSSGITKTLPLIVINGEDGLTDSERQEKDLIIKLRGYYLDDVTSAYVVYTIVCGLLMLPLGLALVMFPRRFWEIQTCLIVESGEPTDFALISNVVVGAVLIVAVLILIFFI